MPATITSSEPRSLYEFSGHNFAPRADLDTLSRNKPVQSPNSLTKALQQKYLSYMERDDQVWREQYDIGQAVANLRTGKLLLLRNPITRAYAFVKRDSKFNDNKTVGGLFQFYSTKLTAEWLSSRPERDPICPSDDDQIEEFISAVKIVQDHYDRKFFDDNYEEQESLSAQDYGTWVTRFRYDPELKDIVCELLDFPACRWDIRFRAEDSSYFIYESKCSNAVLEHLLKADIAEDGDSDDEHYGRRIIEEIAKQGGNVRGQGKEMRYGVANNVAGENHVVEMWLQPQEYCDIFLEQDEVTVSGQVLKRGDIMGAFPYGLIAIGMHNMQTIPWIFPENHKDHIVTGIYHLQSFSGVGKGISDAVDVKKELDNFYSQRSAYVSAHSTPATYYAQDLITEEQARNIGKPRKVIPVDFKNAPEGMKSINEAVQAIAPMNPGDGIWRMDEQLRADLQMSMQVTDFSNGMPGVDNNTATGARIGDANAEMILVPQHRNKADHRKRCDVVIYNLFKRYVHKPMFFATRAKNGITKGKYLSGSRFDGVDIDFEVVANSEVPNTPLQDQMALDRVLERTGGVMGLLEAVATNPDITGDVLDLYGVKLSIPKKTDIARICRFRIEQAKKLLDLELKNQQVMAQTFQAVGMQMPPIDNVNLAASIVSKITPPISPKEPFAQQKAQWMAELLDSDEMQYAQPGLRYIVEELIDRQIQTSILGEMQVAQDQNAAMVMANLPTILGEQMMTNQNQALQGQQAAEQAQRQMASQQAQAASQLQLKGMEADVTEKQAVADHGRAKELSDDSHKKALQLKAIDVTAQREAAKEQAKNRPRASA